jgi:hypothetical protein
MTVVYALECELCKDVETVGMVAKTSYKYAHSCLSPYHTDDVTYSHVCDRCRAELDAEAWEKKWGKAF